MNVRSVKLALVLLLVVCLGGVLPARAQSSSTGSVVGTVSDQTGAVVDDATVTLTDVSTNTSRSTTSNASGRYLYVNVNPGTYTITATKPGFATSRAEHLVVNVGLTLTVNLSLKVGAASVIMDVTSVGAELQNTQFDDWQRGHWRGFGELADPWPRYQFIRHHASWREP